MSLQFLCTNLSGTSFCIHNHTSIGSNMKQYTGSIETISTAIITIQCFRNSNTAQAKQCFVAKIKYNADLWWKLYNWIFFSTNYSLLLVRSQVLLLFFPMDYFNFIYWCLIDVGGYLSACHKMNKWLKRHGR